MVVLTQVQLLAAPKLQIETLPGGQFRLGWPATEPGYALEESTALGLNAAWSPVPALPLPDGSSLAILVTAGVRQQFFRLSQVSEV